jgi:hypothetical protein
LAEVEIHAAHALAEDPFAQRVGVLVGIIGILLSVVTILSHREHTAAVVHKTEANDQWAFYQAKKIREHAEEIGAQILSAVAVDATRVSAQVAQRQQNQARYAQEAADIEKRTRIPCAPRSARCASISLRAFSSSGW